MSTSQDPGRELATLHLGEAGLQVLAGIPANRVNSSSGTVY